MPSNALVKQHLAILQDDDADLKEKGKAAVFFRDRAQQGYDIEAAVPLLIQLYVECHQVPVMAPAADAVVLHYLRLEDYDSIIAFIEKDTYKMFSLESVDRIVESGKDITPLIPQLLQFFPNENYGLYHIIRDYLNQIPSDYSNRFKKIADMLVENKALRIFLPFLVQEGAIGHMDLGPALPALATLLADRSKHVRNRTATAMHWAVEGRTDFSAITDVLEQSLGKSKEDPEIRETVAYCWTYTHARNGKWDEIKRLKASPIAEIRKGIFWALGIRFNNDDKKNSAVLPLLLEGLVDAEPILRQRAAAAITAAGQKKIAIVPDATTLGKLLEGLKSGTSSEELSEYLYQISVKNAKIAQTISTFLEGADFKTSGAAKQLAEKLLGLLAGAYSPICSICRHIPRSSGGYGSPPSEARVLNLPTPSLDCVSLIRKCPECGTYYYYMYAEEMDDLSIDRSMDLHRLDPVEALQRLQGNDRVEYEQKLPDLLKKFRADLQHPVEFARSEAAWALARYALDKQQWNDIQDLLQIPDVLIRRNVFQELFNFGFGKLPLDLLRDRLREAINDSDSKIRYNAASILSQEIIARKDYASLAEFLDHPREEAVAAITYWIWMAVRDSQFDISRLRERLVEFTRSKIAAIRDHARYTLIEAKPHPGKSAIDVLIDNLSADDVKVRKDAAMSLVHLAEEKTDISKAFPALIEMLKDKEMAWYAIDALHNAASWGKLDITLAVPALIRMLEKAFKKPSDSCTDIEQTLYKAMKNGTNISAAYPALAKLLLSRKVGVEIFEEAMKRGEDLSTLESDIRINDNDYDSEFSVKLLTYIYARGKKWDDLKSLLEHENKNVPGPAASWLAEVPDDITPIIPALVKNVLHSYWYVRDSSVRALLRFMQQDDRNLKLVKPYFQRLSPEERSALQDSKRLQALSELLDKIDQVG